MAPKQVPEGMIEKKIKTARPLYIAAAVFAVCALALPVYSLWGLLVCVAATGAAYWVALRKWGTRVVWVQAPGLDFDTGEKALDQILSKAEADLKQLQALNRRISNQTLSAAIDRMERSGNAILTQVSRQPAAAKNIRKFAAYYLPTAVKVLEAYADLEALGAKGENARAVRAQVEQNAETIARAFEAQLDALFAGQALDVSSDLDVLEAMAAGDGLAGAAPVQSPAEEEQKPRLIL